MARPSEIGTFRAFQAWTFSPPPGVDVRSITPVPRAEPVASFGKVLGNRTTMYKFVNPRMTAVVLAGPNPVRPSCEVAVLDGAKGTVLYRRVLPTAGAGCEVKLAISENWMVYHFWDGEDSRGTGSKGWRLVSVEFYEGASVDRKIKRYVLRLSF
jgi:ER membrane protein complex subunit 1